MSDLTPRLVFTAAASLIRGCCGTPDTEPCPRPDNCPRITPEESP
jgi:hypothetical protein